MFRIEPFNYADCLYVADRIQPEDMRNIAATRPDVTPAALAAVCEAAGDYAVIAYYGTVPNEPVAVMGAIPWHPGVYSGYMFATERFPVIGLAMTKWARRHFFAALRQLGARRVESHIIARDTKTRRWLSAIGAHEEAEVPSFGVNGELYIRFAYLWDDDNV
jgi:hypothetical protein